MKIKSLIYTVALGAAVGFAHPAYARTKELTDATFAKKAAAGGLTEVELGKLAQQNGDSQDVKDFGAKMVTDHSKINDDLKAIAAKDNLTIPEKPNAEQRDTIDTLGKKTGKAFDDAYIRGMVRAHVHDKELFTEEAANTKNPDLKQFANDSLGVITEHLNMIEGIADTHGIATGHHGRKSTTMALDGMAPAPAAAGDSGQSKSGLAPGANANPAPADNSANGTSTDTGSSLPPTPNTGDGGAGKSGLAPGANANPAPQPQ
jgi:putative membrane protein